MKLSINTSFKNKIPDRKNAYAEGWVSLDLSAAQLIGYIAAGFAFSAQYNYQYRQSANFLAVTFIAVDIDGRLSLEDAKNDEFIGKYAALMYTTPSHGKDGKDRFRVVFETASVIDSAAVWRDALTGLALRYDGDLNATSGAQIFFGSLDCLSAVVPGNILPDEELEALITEGRVVREAARRGKLPSTVNGANVTGRHKVPRDLQIKCVSGETLYLHDIPQRTRVHCPFHYDEHPSAFVLTSNKGNPGIHCSKCMQTFWIEGSARVQYDYFAFERETVELASSTLALAPENSLAEADQIFGSIIPQAGKRAIVLNRPHLPGIPHTKGVALIRSPKGSGKTKVLVDVVQYAKQQNRSVLVIGHRRTLLRECAAKLVLHCYLDDEERQFQGTQAGPKRTEEMKKRWSQKRPDYYAVCLDSLAARLPAPRKFDIVIIDECEQVLSHVCSGTIEHPEPILKVLTHYISNAETLYMLDADLNTITTGFVRRSRATLRAPEVIDPTLQVVNLFRVHRRTCEIYESERDLRSDLLASAKAGKRLFVACNSKRRAEVLEKWLVRHVEDIRTRLITADEKDEPAVQAFLANVQEEFLKYDVVLASPAIGTGIDITFPNGEQKVDVV